jgi:hypothetical protein
MSESSVISRPAAEFTPVWYDDLLEAFQASGYRIRPVGHDPVPGDILLRHDVDLSIDSALEMARKEALLGIQSTYFVLVASPLYNVHEAEVRESIREISDLGHDVGLHFSTHQYRLDPGQTGALVDRVSEERQILETVVEDVVEPVSFHAPPEWILEHEFDAFPSTYEPALFTEIGYAADSGQRWREEPLLTDGKPQSLQILAHPGLWTEDDASFEECVERAIGESCRRSTRSARSEFLEGVRG